MSPRLESFSDFFALIDEKNLPKLADVYTDELCFIDPVHQVNGLGDLSAYLQNICGGLIFCRFSFHSHIESGDSAWLVWTMHYAHPRISGGKELSIDGATELKFEGDKVCYHRDFYDMGAMLYEHVPILGSMVRCIKQRLS